MNASPHGFDWRKTVWLAFPILIGLTWAVYYSSLNVVFHFDDIPFVIEQAQSRDLAAAWKAFWEKPFFPSRDLVILTMALNNHFHGLTVQGYHAVNITFHGINAALVWAMLVRLGMLWSNPAVPRQAPARPNIPPVAAKNNNKKSSPLPSVQAPLVSTTAAPLPWALIAVAYGCAALFAVHPFLTSSVTYITQRNGEMATMFYMMAFLSYLRLRETSKWTRPFWLWLGAVVLCYWLISQSKEVGLTFPLFVVAYEFLIHIRDTQRLRQIFKWAVPLAALAILAMVGFLYAKGLFEGGYFVGFNSATLWGPWEQFQTKSRALLHYLHTLVLPLDRWMNIDHDFEISGKGIEGRAMFAVAVHALVIAMGILAAWRRYFLAAAGVAWFYVVLSPYMILPERDVLVDYKAYMASVGAFLVLAEIVLALLRLKVPGWLLGLLFLPLCGVGAWASMERNADYATTATIWKDSIRKAPFKARTHHNLGYAYAQEGNFAGARLYFQKSLQVSPGFLLARLNIARVYMRQGLAQEAILQYQILGAMMQTLPVRDLGQIYFDGHYELGQAYAAQGQYEGAIREYQQVLQNIDPNLLAVLDATGKAFMDWGRATEAKAYFERVLQLNPNVPSTMISLATIHLREQNPKLAIPLLSRAVQLVPNNPDAFNNLGVALGMSGDKANAMQAFQQALQANPQHREAQQNLRALQGQPVVPTPAAP